MCGKTDGWMVRVGCEGWCSCGWRVIKIVTELIQLVQLVVKTNHSWQFINEKRQVSNEMVSAKWTMQKTKQGKLPSELS